MLADLVRVEFATVGPEMLRVEKRDITIARICIMDAPAGDRWLIVGAPSSLDQEHGSLYGSGHRIGSMIYGGSEWLDRLSDYPASWVPPYGVGSPVGGPE